MHHLVWNVDPAIVSFGPFTVHWYGLLFARGFLVGFQVMAQIYRAEQRPLENLSSLLSYVMLGTIIGARLGHVLFYQPDYYLVRPWEIPMVWHGGLASHGGFAGVIIALYLYLRKHRDMSFIELADRLAIACLPAATMIRIGNFFNSEIIGRPSDLPWAIVFARVDDLPRHPAMIYEAATFLLVFCALYVAYWRTRIIQFPGRVFGITLATCFFARFMIEFVKENQMPFENQLPLNMGQLLSVPFVLTGIVLIYASSRTPPKSVSPTPVQYDNPIAKHTPK